MSDPNASEGERRASADGSALLRTSVASSGTHFDWDAKDERGHTQFARQRKRLRRARLRRPTAVDSTAGPTIDYALTEVNRLSASLGVPDRTGEMAAVVVRRAYEDDLVRGHRTEAIAAGALYAACRCGGITRSLDKVGSASRVDRTTVGRAYRYLSSELNLHARPNDPNAFVSRFGDELGMSEETVRTAEWILECASEDGITTGRSPTSLAAGALYAAGLLCNEKHTQQAVADVAQVSVVTIRDRYQEQVAAIGEHVDRPLND